MQRRRKWRERRTKERNKARKKEIEREQTTLVIYCMIFFFYVDFFVVVAVIAQQIEIFMREFWPYSYFRLDISFSFSFFFSVHFAILSPVKMWLHIEIKAIKLRIMVCVPLLFYVYISSLNDIEVIYFILSVHERVRFLLPFRSPLPSSSSSPFALFIYRFFICIPFFASFTLRMCVFIFVI